MKIKTSGFTLIELLVVIAIIGILSSVVLASLGTARTKAADTAIKGALAQVRSQAELYYDSNNSYMPTGTAGTSTANCQTLGLFGDATVKNILNSATTSNAAGTATCGTSASYWAVSVPLKGGNHWCVDSLGAAKSISGAVASAGCN